MFNQRVIIVNVVDHLTNPSEYLDDNLQDPLKKCPLLNPYVINSDNPSIDTTKNKIIIYIYI